MATSWPPAITHVVASGRGRVRFLTQKRPCRGRHDKGMDSPVLACFPVVQPGGKTRRRRQTLRTADEDGIVCSSLPLADVSPSAENRFSFHTRPQLEKCLPPGSKR